MKLIIIEDEPEIRYLLLETLETFKIGCSYEAFESYEEYLKLSSFIDFDIALLDVSLKGRNGISIAKEMLESNSNLKIIFMTGHHTETILMNEDYELIKNKNITILNKPFDLYELKLAIKQ